VPRNDGYGRQKPVSGTVSVMPEQSHVIAGKPCHPELVEGSLSKGACRRELVEGSLSNKSHVIAGKPCHPELVEGSLYLAMTMRRNDRY
jgi:hypothetical protein